MLRESRMKKGMDPKALKLSSSIEHDKNIFLYDILVDVAHVLTLKKGGYLSEEEAKEIILALKKVKDSGFREDWPYEDVHEAIEAEVTKITPHGAKMHTGRSRNDEVATCLRMFARDHLLNLAEAILNALDVLIKKAEKSHFLMPGFTHLQYAQPTRLSHHLLAYHDMLSRDFERAIEAFRRVNKSPLGSAAFASTGYSLDRVYAARLLGFDGVVEHSEDAVASRDFVIESIFVAAEAMLSISRIAEEIVLFSSEFGFITLPDEFSSTSSIMPQKKNPDIAELLRANAGKIAGNLTSAMMIYKATPFSYNRDFQEMNPLLYESLKRTHLAVEVFASMMGKIKFNPEITERKASKGFATATELADMLVMKYGVPFRMAHRIVGRLAAKELERPTASDVNSAAKELGVEINVRDEDVLEALDVEKVVENRGNLGGTSKAEVERMIKARKSDLKDRKTLLRKLRGEVKMGLKMLYDEAKKLGVDINV
ncbi:argininosuccinate lyase [Archaeoglobus fulgidus]|jgi:argininosuccinate lyase|uniref:Argininosuccinate lyase n=3 Tax=Archaeoglobus fulgidus TaxID=2234 RepID=ARLY_ARCFU|nr:argininosuccinate lyase [Archaeoglobus fulgidus]O29379.1 RecName: Full=Argininosuccinate lyase; Short=ASAL; AltName: Full=Arginosuccinase [Archaeoglobus fulgidus DSM 4304]AAB90359.1 argininosuccinate lyase (argH) [Archaeoglobus fulgidus DSM 4304]AIG97758.1 argininosuccinate lyase [Archaeoglobus fulgidus DSM 8774]KUJ93214.1 MAG: Argininosuccinate lyase [Archaeoglobus fulgidus]KUK06060.1 MAG: Argininosuccinate lyase [Archaeoglobus fulgidus]